MNYILLATYLFAIGGFLFIFYKNGFDLDKTIKFVKVKLLHCCVKNKKKLDEKVGVKVREEIEDSMLTLESCDNPIEGVPLDLCISGDLDETDIELRKEIAGILGQQKNFVMDGGLKKTIVPLEATIFLTKNMNPLVNEDGEILIISETKHTNKGNIADINEVKMFLKDSEVKNEQGDLIYEDPQEIIKLLKLSLENSHFAKEEAKEKETKKQPQEEVKSEQQVVSKPKVETHQPDVLETQKVTSTDDPFDMSNMDDLLAGADETPFDIQDEEINFDDQLSIVSGGPLFQEPEETEEIDRNSFYKELSFKRVKNLTVLNQDHLKEDLSLVLNSDEIIGALKCNLLKTKPLIFSANKEYIFVDMNNIFFAFSKIYGIESKNVINIFQGLKGKDRIDISDIFRDALKEDMSDIVTDNFNVTRVFIQKEDLVVYSWGIYLQTDSFMRVLTEKNFDFMRQYPYETNLKILTEDIKTNIPLHSKIVDTEIKK